MSLLVSKGELVRLWFLLCGLNLLIRASFSTISLSPALCPTHTCLLSPSRLLPSSLISPISCAFGYNGACPMHTESSALTNNTLLLAMEEQGSQDF